MSAPASLRRTASVLSVSAIAVLATAATASAATYTVTTTQDPAPSGCTPTSCSLREAVIAANATPDDDTIVLPAGDYGLSLPGRDEGLAATGDLDLRANSGRLAITGAGARTTTVDAHGLDRVLDVSNGADVQLSGFTVTGGMANGTKGGGGIASSGELTLTDMAVVGNTVTAENAMYGGGAGGGISQGSPTGAHDNDLTLVRTTVADNAAGGSGGGVSAVGDTFVATNSTIADNRVDTSLPDVPDFYSALGGGAFIGARGTLTNVTIVGNTVSDPQRPGGAAPSTAGSGVSVEGRVEPVNTIIADNHALNGSATNCDFVLFSTGPNLGDDGSCFGGPSDINSTTTGLGSFGDHGGPTDTVALLAGSPAIDAGDSAVAPPTDQRGGVRPAGSPADIGAFELGADVPVPPQPPTTEAPGTTPPATTPPATSATVVTAPLPALHPKALVTVGAARRATRLPYRYTLSGRVLLAPNGVAGAVCAGGVVSVRVLAGKRTVAAKRAFVTPACGWSKKVAFTKWTHLGRSGKLTVRVRFLGTSRLAASDLATTTIGYRRSSR